jgi:predicted DNA-binding protein
VPGKHNDESQILQAWVTKSLCSQLDKLAKRAKTSRAKYVKKVLEQHVSEQLGGRRVG